MTLTVNQLKIIHKSVFDRFTYVSDKKMWGKDEYWESPSEIPDGNKDIRGDCDTFALACRKECRKLGIPSRLVFCYTESEIGHLVLEVDGWIFDNRHAQLISRDVLPYRWIRISGYNKGDPWRRLI